VLECKIRPGSYTVHKGWYANDIQGIEYVCEKPKGNVIITAVLFKKYNQIDIDIHNHKRKP